MHQALRLGRDVYMSSVKEPGFFTNDREYPKGIEHYLDAYFLRAESAAVRGESTPWYLYSTAARERIAAIDTLQVPRFLVFVRDPAERALSMYVDQRRIGREARSFEQAIEEELDGLARGDLVADVRQRYVWCGHYADHIVDWKREFGDELVTVLEFEDLVSDPEPLWKEVGSFLDHDLGEPPFDSLSDRDRNAGGELRWPRLDAFIRSFEGGANPVIERSKALLPPGLHRRALEHRLAAVEQERRDEPAEQQALRAEEGPHGDLLVGEPGARVVRRRRVVGHGVLDHGVGAGLDGFVGDAHAPSSGEVVVPPSEPTDADTSSPALEGG